MFSIVSGTNWGAISAVTAIVSVTLTLILLPALRLTAKKVIAGVGVSLEEAIKKVINEIVTPRLEGIEKRLAAVEDGHNDLQVRVSHLEGIQKGRDEVNAENAKPNSAGRGR